jgi:hypothetical protein
MYWMKEFSESGWSNFLLNIIFFGIINVFLVKKN